MSRLLFWVSLLAASILVGLVLVAPWVTKEPIVSAGWPRVLGLFAHDAAVRRVSLFAAIGLVVSAWVFFRPSLSAS